MSQSPECWNPKLAPPKLKMAVMMRFSMMLKYMKLVSCFSPDVIREEACATTHEVIASSYSAGGQLLMGKSGEVCHR